MAASIILALLSIFHLTQSHLFMGNPPPFRWSEFTDTTQLVMPMNGIGIYGQQPFPCKGHHIGNNEAADEPGVTWQAGQNVIFQYGKLAVRLGIHLLTLSVRLFDSTNTTGPSMNQIEGAAHSGGSCQISFSYDQGITWVVVQNFEGNCPRVRKGEEGTVTNHYDINQDYHFVVPKDFPSGDSVIVAWWALISTVLSLVITILGTGFQTLEIENTICRALLLR